MEGRGIRRGGGRSGRAPVTVTTASAEPERPGAGQAPLPAHAAESAALRPAAGAPLGECPGRAPRPPQPGRGRQEKPRLALPASLPASRSSAGRRPAHPARPIFCGVASGRAAERGPRSAWHSSRCVWASSGSRSLQSRAAVGSRCAPPQLPFSCGKVVAGVCPCAPAFPLVLATAVLLKSSHFPVENEFFKTR